MTVTDFTWKYQATKSQVSVTELSYRNTRKAKKHPSQSAAPTMKSSQLRSNNSWLFRTFISYFFSLQPGTWKSGNIWTWELGGSNWEEVGNLDIFGRLAPSLLSSSQPLPSLTWTFINLNIYNVINSIIIYKPIFGWVTPCPPQTFGFH